MTDETSTISIYVYRSRTHWHHLMANCLQPLVTRLQADKQIQFWFIHLLTLRGHCVKLTFTCKTSIVNHLLEEFNKRVKDYLQLNPSPEETDPKAPTELFVGYPNDSVWYQQIKRRPGVAYDLDKHVVIRRELSNNIMTAFTDSAIDNEQLLIYSIYVVAVTVTTYFSTAAQAREMVKSLLQNTSRDEGTDAWDNIYQENWETFSEIFEQCSAPDTTDNGENQEEWIEQLRSFVTTQSLHMPFEYFFPVLVDLIYEHTGIDLTKNNLHTVLSILDKILNRTEEPTTP